MDTIVIDHLSNSATIKTIRNVLVSLKIDGVGRDSIIKDNNKFYIVFKSSTLAKKAFRQLNLGQLPGKGVTKDLIGGHQIP